MNVNTTTTTTTESSLLGPLAPAIWRAQTIGDGSARSPVALVTPDAANEASTRETPATFYCLPNTPLLAHNASGSPAISLTLLLNRQPASTEETIYPLIIQGFLNITPTLELPRERLIQLQNRNLIQSATYKQLYIRQVTFTIEIRSTNESGPVRILASNTVDAGASAPIAATLSRDDTLRILAALENQSSGLNIRAKITYRAYDPKLRKSLIATTEITGKLEDTLGGVLNDQPREAYIHLLAVGSNGSGTSTQSSNGLSVTRQALSDVPRRVVVPALEGSVERTNGAKVAARMSIDGRIHEIDDEQFEHFRPRPRPHPPLQSLPVIDNIASPIWKDRLNPNKYWFATQFKLIEPDRATRPEDSAFLFTVKRSGATNSGQPGLDAFIKVMAQSSISDAAHEALKPLGGVEVHPVPLDQLTFTFELPYRDESGSTRMQPLNATVLHEEGGIYTLQVALLNEWARLGYGALSVRNFQTQAARLVVSYQYRGYASTSRNLSRNEKRTDLNGTSVGNGSSTLSSRQQDRLGGGSGGGDGGPVVIHTTPVVVTSTATPVVVTSPVLKPVVDPPDDLERDDFLIRPYRYEQGLETLFPCDIFGAFYRQETEGSVVAIGCQDALTLGETSSRQYTEAINFRHKLYRVFRSLQQPGTFLVLPTGYLIARRDADSDSKSYDPAILVYSTYDAQVPTNNRVVFQMQLEPAIPPYVRRQLLELLSTEAPNPIIEYPTSIPADIEYNWSIGDDLSIVPRTIKYSDGFVVTLSTDLTGALLVNNLLKMSGLWGSAIFKLSDGSELSTSLELGLAKMTGPWASGPIEISTASTGLQLTNRIERSVNISDLLVYEGDLHGIYLPVETSLAPNENCIVVVEPNKVKEAYAVSAYKDDVPFSLEEVRAFVEDMQLTVIFVDLVNLPTHNLLRNEIAVRLSDLTEPTKVELANPSGGPPIGQVAWVLPLTTYLEKHDLYFQVTKVPVDGSPPTQSPWLQWDIQTKGNVVSLTWEIIQ